ncbi:MAG: hypothetical protein WC620_07260 [Methanoregula sp.]|jgi:hypothetical protein
MTKPKVYDPEVPLFLIATAVADGVRKRGGKLFRISIVRTHSHAYRIKFKCRVKEAGIPTIGPSITDLEAKKWTFSAGERDDPAGLRERSGTMDHEVSGDGRTDT